MAAHHRIRVANGLNALVFFLLLAVIVLTSIPYGTVDPWWESLFEGEVFLITAIWILQVLFAGKWGIGRLTIVLPLVLITVFAYVQTIVWPGAGSGLGRLTSQHTLTVDLYQTTLTARKTLALTLFFGLLLLHTSTPRRLRWLVGLVIGLGVASAAFGIIRQLLQSPDSPAGFVLPFLFYGVGYGHFIYHNLFAYLMEMTFALVMGLVLGGGITRARIPLLLAMALPVWAALVLSNSRGGVLSLACQSIFLLFTALTWYSERRLSHDDGEPHRIIRFFQSSVLVRSLIIVAMIGTLIIGVFWMGGEGFASRMRELGEIQGTNDGLTRVAAWGASWDLIKHNSWTGTGFGTYFLAITRYHDSSGRFKLEQAHNDYLDLPANGGIVAVLLAAWFITAIILRIRSNLKSRDRYRRAVCFGATAAMISIAVHSVVDFGLQITGIALVFGAIVVIAVADKRVESTSKNESASTTPSAADSTRSIARWRFGWRQLLSFALALIALFFCYRLTVNSVNAGVSRFFSVLATLQRRIEPADTAVRFAPADPEAHYTRALTLINLQRLNEAVAELQQVTRLRPNYYYVWLDLGVTFDRLGDQASAVSALREAVRLAPSFAQPHWQLGNFLYREGRFDEAFPELRLGARSNPSLIEGMLQLAWVSANGDTGTLESLVGPQTRRSRFELARFLARQSQGAEAARQVRELGNPQDDWERMVLRQTISALLTSNQYADAYSAWSATHFLSTSPASNDFGQLLNGDFLDPILRDEPGFGWQTPPVRNVVVAIDPEGPEPNTRSLRIEFAGDSPWDSQTVSQLLLVKPKTRYSLNFSAKARELVSGGPPVFQVLDPASNPIKLLGQSKPLLEGAGAWSAYQVEFFTDESTAVLISLRRTPCTQNPCPIFGRLWLGRFSLVRP
jgi:tetratricopeptide (TPR) repeat protein